MMAFSLFILFANVTQAYCSHYNTVCAQLSYINFAALQNPNQKELGLQI